MMGGAFKGSAWFEPKAEILSEAGQLWGLRTNKYGQGSNQPLRTTVQRYFAVPAGAALEAFSDIARHYPVFELLGQWRWAVGYSCSGWLPRTR